MPRFVILTHDYPCLHWDFMLEKDAALRTWRLLQEPRVGEFVAAEAIADHRKRYLDYEGPVSNDRGQVHRWDWGEYTCIEESAAFVQVHLAGQKLHGNAELQRDESAQTWTWRIKPLSSSQ